MRFSHLLILAAGALAFAQDKPAANPEFEVATVKPSEPLDAMGGKVMVRMGVRNDGAMVTYDRMTVKALVQNAYGVKDYQVTGAPWMDQQQDNIPPSAGRQRSAARKCCKACSRNASKSSLPSREEGPPGIRNGNGQRRPETEGGGSEQRLPVFAGGPGAPPPPPPPGGPANTRQMSDGGRGGAPPEGAIMMRMGPNGGHTEMRMITVQRLGEMISRYVERPVIDETGIEGKYDFSLDLSSDEMANMMAGMRAAMPMAMATRGGGPGPDAGRGGAEAPNAPEGGSIFQSLQSYGLKLEPKKAPIEVIVIDSAEKDPIQN